MKAVQVNQSGAWENIEKDLPKPAARQVRVKVQACGVCHSDVFVKERLWPDLHLPRTPGHEVAGVIDEIGQDVTEWTKGQRVGIGWAGKYCGKCQAYRHGDFILCENHQITGIHYDGGYADYMLAPVEALARIPDELSFAEAAPLLCAGITTFNALRHSGARPGDVVAVLGIGGLGHLAVQFANKMGFRTVAVSRGADKAELARKLGAHDYLDSDKDKPAEALKKLGGARVILVTAPSAKAIAAVMDGLGKHGNLVIVGASSESLPVTSMQLISGNRSIMGWPSGTAVDSEETMRFCALTGVRPMIETFPLEQAPDAFDHMISNKARFRAVLAIGK